jgi:glucose-1-phosphate cytidylyltransferase
MRSGQLAVRSVLGPVSRPTQSSDKNLDVSRLNIVILAGGLGTRLSEETNLKPKPMVEIGGVPILWHIMKHFASHGMKDFFVALGYRGEVIKRYFLDYHQLNRNLRIDLASGRSTTLGDDSDDWRVQLVDTGQTTQTGGRIQRLRPWLERGTFLVTYGDGVSNVDLGELIRFHRSHGKIATVTAVRPPARFGSLELDGDLVAKFAEKPQVGEGWINGGFLVFEPELFDYLDGDESILEAHALERLAQDRQLSAFRHDGFWQCMDTLRDKQYLDRLWQEDKAPWKTWI